MNLREGICVALTERSQGLPEYQRVYGFALTDQSLPRTRLGNTTFMLPGLYRRALAGGPQREARSRSGPRRQALLQNLLANAVWTLLQERYPQQTLDLDMNLSLELNVDLFTWTGG